VVYVAVAVADVVYVAVAVADYKWRSIEGSKHSEEL
jgi:hypothetical protein